MIPYGKQSISQQDIDAVVNVLRSDFLTQGPAVPLFEEALCEYTGAQHCCAVNSATSALHIACLALGLEPGDWLWTTPNTFVASANCGLYCGANVSFVDICPKTYNLSVSELEQQLDNAQKNGTLPKVLVAVDFAGQSCDLAKIKELSQKYQFAIIEDASHAIGGTYKNNPTGCCEYADITIFSFHPVKIITTAEGGAALTNDTILAKRMEHLRSHGISRDKRDMHNKKEEPWYYEQLNLGFNYRMTELQAALGKSQLNKIQSFVERRRNIAKVYDNELANEPITLPYQASYGVSSYHLYPIQVNDAKKRLSIFNKLRDKGIGVNVHYIPVHTQPFYKKLGFKLGDYPESERYYAKTISLPIHYSLSEKEQLFIIDTLKDILNKG